MDNTIFQELTILYVEDDSDIRDEFQILLESRFKAVFLAENGEKGLALYKIHRPDLVVSDVTMPIMDGLEMAKHIKELDEQQPVILATALNDSTSLTKAINIGVDGYLGKPVRMSSVLNTLAKHAEIVNLRKSHLHEQKLLAEYKHAIEMGASVLKTDAYGKIISVNGALCDLSGYTEEVLIGNSYTMLLQGNESTNDLLAPSILSQKGWKGELKNKKFDGTSYFLAVTVIPIRDESNSIVEYVFLCHDITQQIEYSKMLEKQLSHSISNLEEKMILLRQYEKAIEISNAFTRTDLKGNITYVNDKFCQLSGYSKEELLNQPHNIVRHSDNPSSLFHELWNTIKSNQIWNGTLKNMAKDGTAFYVNTTIVPIVDTGGKIVEYMSIRHDVSELIELTRDIEDTQKEVVFTMGAIGEARSKETGNHVKRVAEYSKILALEYGLSLDEAELIKMASPMHDIGKVGIPDNILNKPGKLDSQEFEIMQTHSVLGYEMLKHSNRPILKAAAIISLEHHEKWNGTGYPHGKKGEEIHIYGRITAIADVFDALGSNRCYKKAWELEKILKLFEDEKGKHFDPILVDIFFAKLETFLEIRWKFNDDL